MKYNKWKNAVRSPFTGSTPKAVEDHKKVCMIFEALHWDRRLPHGARMGYLNDLARYPSGDLEQSLKAFCVMGNCRHQLNGDPITANPTRLFRVMTRTDWEKRIKNGRFSARNSVGHQRQLAASGFDCFRREVLGNWLFRGHPDSAVFCTFRPDSGAAPPFPPGQYSAEDIHDMLALPNKKSGELILLEYDKPSDMDLRFPTIPDAEAHHEFCPAGANEPWGWTMPRRDGLRPQPEAVHKNRTMDIMVDFPRSLGRIP